jgi:hypothetical protein
MSENFQYQQCRGTPQPRLGTTEIYPKSRLHSEKKMFSSLLLILHSYHGINVYNIL